MKKVVLLLGFMFLGSCISFASDCDYKCVEPYNMSSKISSFFSSVTGLNFTRTKISEIVLKKSLSKSVDGKKLKVNIDSYSGKDLANGIFKSIEISGKELNVEGVHLSSVNLKSVCDFNYVTYDKKGNLTFKEDFPMSFELQMSADDINKTMQSDKYTNAVKNLNKLEFAGLKIKSTETSIRANKLYYTITVGVPFMKDQKMELTGDLKVVDGKIDLKNTRLTSNSKSFDLKKVDSLVNYINPLDFSVNIFDNKDAKVYIKNVAIKNNIVIADGMVIIPKD